MFEIGRDNIRCDAVVFDAIRIEFAIIIVSGVPEIGGFVVPEDAISFVFDIVVIASILDLDVITVIADTIAEGVTSAIIIIATVRSLCDDVRTPAHTLICSLSGCSSDELTWRWRRSNPSAGRTYILVAPRVTLLESAGGWTHISTLGC